MAKVPIEELIETFIEKGGRINKSYLRDLSRNHNSLVYLKGWYKGTSLRRAIERAIAGQ